jgi:hypothetical protein
MYRIHTLRQCMKRARGDPDIRSSGEQLIQRLKSLSDLPGSLGLSNVNFHHELGNDAIHGTYADVFHREYDGQQIAVKLFRSFTTHSYRLVFQQVFRFDKYFHVV